MIIDPQDTRRFRKTDALEMSEQRMDSGCPRSRRTTYGVADADNLVDEAARQRNFMVIVFMIMGWRRVV